MAIMNPIFIVSHSKHHCWSTYLAISHCIQGLHSMRIVIAFILRRSQTPRKIVLLPRERYGFQVDIGSGPILYPWIWLLDELRPFVRFLIESRQEAMYYRLLLVFFQVLDLHRNAPFWMVVRVIKTVFLTGMKLVIFHMMDYLELLITHYNAWEPSNLYIVHSRLQRLFILSKAMLNRMK